MVEILALILWIEAQGEPFQGKLGTAAVIYSRGHGDPQAMVAAVTSTRWNGKHGLKLLADARPDRSSRDWKDCVMISELMVSGGFKPTIKANLVHAASIDKPEGWKTAVRVAKIGKQIFYYDPRVVA